MICRPRTSNVRHWKNKAAVKASRRRRPVVVRASHQPLCLLVSFASTIHLCFKQISHTLQLLFCCLALDFNSVQSRHDESQIFQIIKFSMSIVSPSYQQQHDGSWRGPNHYCSLCFDHGSVCLWSFLFGKNPCIWTTVFSVQTPKGPKGNT